MCSLLFCNRCWTHSADIVAQWALILIREISSSNLHIWSSLIERFGGLYLPICQLLYLWNAKTIEGQFGFHLCPRKRDPWLKCVFGRHRCYRRDTFSALLLLNDWSFKHSRHEPLLTSLLVPLASVPHVMTEILINEHLCKNESWIIHQSVLSTIEGWKDRIPN